MVSRDLFTLLVALVALQRLFEVRLSRRHERALFARGAQEHAAHQMPWMVALHGAWLVCMLGEVWGLHAPFDARAATVALCVFFAGQALRLAAMRALGPRWTVRVITLPEPPVTSGIFRYVRHPNYLGVALEIAALPLVHGAYRTALVFSVLNAVLLAFRVRAEERALAESSDYEARFKKRPRFLPGRAG